MDRVRDKYIIILTLIKNSNIWNFSPPTCTRGKGVNQWNATSTVRALLEKTAVLLIGVWPVLLTQDLRLFTLDEYLFM